MGKLIDMGKRMARTLVGCSTLDMCMHIEQCVYVVLI
jgi:hypothetical protein